MELNSQGDDSRIVVTDSRFDILKEYDGKTVVFGIRPENISKSENQNKDNYIMGEVSVVENLGAETYVYVPRGETEEGENFLIMKLSRDRNIAVGDKTYFEFAEKSIHIFDKDTDASLVGHR